jgi:hypothetical protein
MRWFVAQLVALEWLLAVSGRAGVFFVAAVVQCPAAVAACGAWLVAVNGRMLANDDALGSAVTVPNNALRVLCVMIVLGCVSLKWHSAQAFWLA